jgi:CRP-like cAMP-binding protein
MFNQFRNNFPLDDSKWLEYTNHFNRLEVPAKTILLEEGEISKRLFIIEKGCIRVWFNNNGKDLTTQFFFENQSVASIESFMKKLPSPVVIETIEPSIVWWISKNDLDKILEEIKEVPELRDRFINMLFERTFDYMKHFVSFIKDSPTQRYLNLIEEKPQIIQRVPQHYIASYLGVSTVHLSRIKSQLHQKK